jgi:hypothetical protein
MCHSGSWKVSGIRRIRTMTTHPSLAKGFNDRVMRLLCLPGSALNDCRRASAPLKMLTVQVTSIWQHDDRVRGAASADRGHRLA